MDRTNDCKVMKKSCIVVGLIISCRHPLRKRCPNEKNELVLKSQILAIDMRNVGNMEEKPAAEELFICLLFFRMVQAEDARIKKFEKDPQICTSGGLSKSLARQCTLFKLQCGRDPDRSELHILRDIIRERGEKEFDRYGELKPVIKQRSAFEHSFAIGRLIGPGKREKDAADMQAKELLIEKNQAQEVQRVAEVLRQMEKGMSLDRHFL